MWKRILIWITGILVLALLTYLLIDFVWNQSYPSTWAVSYDGPAAINSYDQAADIAIDSNGNIYVTGFCTGPEFSNDYATVKYDSDGNELWAARYDGPSGGSDRPYDICIDSANAIYVTGKSEGNTTYDFATIKYDSNGQELWAVRYDGPQNGSDEANGIAVDSQGNAYVTGYSYGEGADYVTIKYDNNGNQIWTARYNGPYSSIDSSNDIAVDNSGNVYITGFSMGNGTSEDYATVKYDNDGNQLWAARYDSPISRYDRASVIKLDNAGNTYVTGYSCIGHYSIEEAFYDDLAITTVKYDPDGEQLWTMQYGRPDKGQVIANDLAVDEQGNIYVTGSITYQVKDYETSDTVTVKYDSDGNELWVAQYNSPEKLWDGSNSIVLDDLGNVFIAGSSASINGSADYITVKYDSEGEELWFSRYNGPKHLRDVAIAIAMDDSGNIYVTGYSYTGDTSTDYVTIKYAPEEP